ncbi:MAG: hypothetical protein RL094_461 [Candidatus Parcubacteria bacterium]|jgi:SulP family sulfate permease
MKSILSEMKANWKAALSVALINIPMSISLAIASGVAPTVGIVTAIWAGLVAAIFGGSHYNVVGPAGALSGILAGYSLIFGPQILPVIALITGVMVLIIWALRWDRYIVFIPSSVVHGFTLSVAFVIGLGQLNSAFGLKGLIKHEKFVGNVVETLRHLGSTHAPTFILFIIGLAMMFALFKWLPKIPNSVVVALFGIAVGVVASKGYLPYGFETIQSKYGALSLNLFSMPHFTKEMFSIAVFKAIPLVAIVVILETLLSAKIADGMTKTRYNQKKEVFGIGLANVVSGLFGGLPATGVFARTAMNIKSGATSRYSAIMNTIVVAIVSFFLLQYFSYLPMAIVASILIYIALRMVALKHFQNLYRFDKTAFILSIVVAVLSIVYDPLIGILLGSGVSLLIFMNYMSKAQSEVLIGSAQGEMERLRVNDINFEEVGGDTMIYRFVGELNYMNAETHKTFLVNLKADKYVIFNFKNLFYIDIDGLDALDEIIEELELHGKHVYVSGLPPILESLFLQKAWYLRKKEQKHVFEGTAGALDKITNEFPKN